MADDVEHLSESKSDSKQIPNRLKCQSRTQNLVLHHIIIRFQGIGKIQMTTLAGVQTHDQKWIGYKDMFFSTVLISQEGFEATTLDSKAIPEGDVLKQFKTTTTTPLSKDFNKANLFGPK